MIKTIKMDWEHKKWVFSLAGYLTSSQSISQLTRISIKQVLNKTLENKDQCLLIKPVSEQLLQTKKQQENNAR